MKRLQFVAIFLQIAAISTATAKTSNWLMWWALDSLVAATAFAIYIFSRDDERDAR